MSRVRSALGVSSLAVPAVLFLSAAEAVGQTSIEELRTVPVSSDVVSDLVEPWLAVSQTDPEHLLTVAMFPDTDSSVVYRSRDGGRSWSRTGPGGVGVFPGGDPMLTFGPDGVAYVSTITPRFLVWRSEKPSGGWSQPVEIQGGSYDRQWLAVDRSGSHDRGRVYAAGKIWIRVLESPARDLMAIAHSIDGGRTFGAPELILPDPAREFLHVVSDLQVDARGRVVVLYSAFERGRGAQGMPQGAFFTLTSDDGGRSFGDPTRVTDYTVYSNAWGHLAMKGLGGGRLVIHPADPDRLYLAWVQPLEGSLQIMVVASSDGGTTWGSPVRVNDGGFGSNHSNPALAVDDRGVVAVTWNDRRDDPSDRCFHLYMAVSTDRGASFGPNQRIGQGRTCPRGGRFVNGGDTQGLVALPGGRFHIAWIDGSGGPMRLMSTVVQVDR